MVCDYQEMVRLLPHEDTEKVMQRIRAGSSKPAKIIKEARDIYEEKRINKELGLIEVWDE
jgi:hypothetical protein